MTTKPKAKKFRIKRPTQPDMAVTQPVDTATEAGSADEDLLRKAQDSLKPPVPERQTTNDEMSEAPTEGAENTIDGIRKEGLTGRQLRMARRVAQKQGLAPTSDFDAVRLLRAKGIDPFQRSNMLELVVPNAAKQAESAGRVEPKVQLPQTVGTDDVQLPSTDTLSPAERRELEIGQIQRDIMRRRRRRLSLLLTRLSFFVFLPTFLAGYYFAVLATPMYGTNSEFLIIQNEGSGGAGALGGLLPTQFATSQDAIAVQGFLQSKDAMLRLDRDLGFRNHFQQDHVDPIQRLEPDATNEEAYKTYKKNVKIGFDPTEGVIRMEVVAADPEISAQFSERLITYAEERVNELSFQKRDDQVRDALNALEQAEFQRRAAQETLVRLQTDGAILDPESVIASIRGQINQVETQLIEKELQLQALLDNARPNQARVDGVRSDVSRLTNQLNKLNERMTDVSRGENSLAQLTVNIQLAQADLATRDMMLQSALQQVERARTEAARQVRYLTVSVRPVAPQEPTYPKVFENTILAFLIFAGIYLMISLTASILREQVTS